jgi:large subunit ribosomal protein L23
MQNVVKKPVITEKSLSLAAKGWYTFAVATHATKKDIATEVAKLYNVTVVDVRTMRYRGKTRRVGRMLRVTASPDWKKSIIQVLAGQTIEAFTVETKEGAKK